jgi:hypothetical protein
VASGEEKEIGSASFFHNDCSPEAFSVTITQPPAYGTTSIITGMVTGGGTLRTGSDPNGCLSRPKQAQKVMYRSNSGFHGTDTVTYEVQGRSGGWTSTVTINVQ